MVGKRMLVSALVGVLVVGAASVGSKALAADEKPSEKVISGGVVKACPKGCYIKIKTDEGKELGLPVKGKDAQATVKTLKTDDQVELTVVACAKGGCPKAGKKDTVTKVEKVTPTEEK